MRRVATVGVLAVASLTAGAACAAPRQTLGTRSSACFRSLPTANAAVHQEGRLVGVRRISRAHLLRVLPQAALPPGKEFCAVAFSDDFHQGQVDKAAGAPQGKDAIVVVDLRGTSVIQTFLVDRMPFHLQHR
ncbi:MAG: hypothetical protein JO050_07730 [Acidimicrobiia bacterium]|nr:hypothetical protein [Acidimicrobiia bacterium]